MVEPAPASVLLHALVRHARRQRASVALRAVAIGILVLALALPLLVAIDGFGAPLALRWTAWITAVVAAGSVVVWHGKALIRRRSLVELAADLEDRDGIGGGILAAGTSFTQHAPRDASAWMINRTVVFAGKAAADIRDWKRVSPVAWQMPLVAAGLSASVLMSALIPGLRPWVERAAYPGCGSGRPGDLHVTAIGGNRRVAAGSEPELAVEVAAGIPSQVIATITWKDGRTERRPLFAVDGAPEVGARWQLRMPPVTTALTWQVEANRQPGGPMRGQSDRRSINLTPGLVPAGFQLRVIPPAYANLPSQTATGDCAAVAGSQLELEATINAPEAGEPHLVAATIVLEPDEGGAKTEVPAIISGSTLRAEWMVRRSHHWSMRLIARGGMETLPDRRWRVTVANDLAPLIQLTTVPANFAADALETVVVTAEDDVALGETLVEVRRDHGNGPLLAAIPVLGDARRRRVFELGIDAAALGLVNGDSLALVPVASDRLGQTTRGEARFVTVTADGAGWAPLTARLARIISAGEAATTALPALSDAWDRCGQDPTARTLLASRLSAWRRALTDAAEQWTPLTDVAADPAARQAVADLSWWASHAVNDLIGELTRDGKQVVALEPAPPLAPGRLQFTIDEFSRVMTSIHRSRDAVANIQFRRAAAAEALAAHHHAASLQADLALQNPPKPGLIASFSADDDQAPLLAGGIEVPAVNDRNLPGLGRDHIRIQWQGAILVARPDLELELTADDGVALTLAGNECLPAEAWGDHPATTWKSGPLMVGWQPLTIRWRQGAGGSLLKIAWAGSATPITAEELRAVQAPDWLMTTDLSAITAHTAALEHHLQRLAPGAGPAAKALAAHREGAWTEVSLTKVLALADQVASQQPDVADVITTGGPLVVSLDLADRALDRARSEPLSPTGRQAMSVALEWLAHAADAAGEDPGAGSTRLRREVVRVAALGANADTSTEIRQVENECARLRKSVKAAPPQPATSALTRPAAILVGRDQARASLALACGSLALELRESLPNQPLLANAVEALEARLRHISAPSEPPLMQGDEAAVTEAEAHIATLAFGPARDVAASALAQAPGGPSDGATRRLATAIAHLQVACRRLDTLLQRPTTAPPAPVSVPLPIEPGVTDAGFARARLQPPTLNDRGIESFRPDQQSAIRAYLARMRRHPPGAP